MLRRVGTVTYGSDPEGFLSRNGKIIGAEKVIPEAGLTGHYYGSRSVVLDGVQFELALPATGSVSSLGINISNSFRTLASELEKHPDVKICFDGVVEVEQAELDSLGPKTRMLGCAPSLNAYGEFPIKVDPNTYRKRSAGGHLHLGVKGAGFFNYAGVDERYRLVPLLDIFVGLPSVLLDRDPNAAERRENYGRAGEYRLPAHGVEYRTLSNFWLRNYTLMSFVFSMADIAIAVLDTTCRGIRDYEQELVDTIDIKRVVDAINANDFDNAFMVFDNQVRPWLAKTLSDDFQLKPNCLSRFMWLAEGIRDNKLPFYFKADPVEHWVTGRQEDFSFFIKRIFG